MSSAAQPTWAHPILRLHHRHVEKQVTAGEAASAELGIVLMGDSIRRALLYERGQHPRTALKALALISVAIVLLVEFKAGVCTPGGMLNPTPADDCATAREPWSAMLWRIDSIFVIVLAGFWVYEAADGQTVARCSKPLYPLLDLLRISATVARPESRHADAIKLSRKVSRLGVHFRAVASDAAKDFGNRRALRSALAAHLNRVDAAFIETADRLAADRVTAARNLAELAALAANNIADGRFTTVLPDEYLDEKAPMEPDRLDGRRLGAACLSAAVGVTVSFYLLSPLGASVELLIPLALVAFPVLVYALLAFRYGLSEATRLTRSIGGFFSSSPPL